jgi:putative FmdB family regulatory protein
MPIYAYKCDDCGHQKDVLQKISDPMLVDCPACGKASFKKQLTAPGFQLKGSGWYVTDFRNGNNATSSSKSEDASAQGSASKTDSTSGGSGSADTAAPASASTAACSGTPAACPACN